MDASLIQLLVQGEPAAFCAEIAKRGNGMAKLPIPGRRRFWVVSNPKAIALILHDRRTFDKGGPFYQTISRALGQDGLFTTNDEWLWRRLHDAMWPSLRRHEIAAAGVGLLAQSLWTQRTAQWDLTRPVALFPELKEFSIELLAAYLFGTQVDSRRLAQLAQEVFAGMAGRVFLPTQFPGGKRYAEAIKNLQKEIDGIIAMHRKTVQRGTMLDMLFRATPRFSHTQIRDQVMTMLMAGHDSTATVLAWALIRLSERQELYGQLRYEALALPQDSATSDAVARIFNAASHEHPAFPMFPCNVAHDTTLMGNRLRVGDQVVVSLYGMHRTPGLPATFDEFLQADSEGLRASQRVAHKPFGAGKRVCPGKDFATYTGGIVLTALLREFSTMQRTSSGEGSRYAMTAPPRDNATMWLRR